MDIDQARPVFQAHLRTFRLRKLSLFGRMQQEKIEKSWRHTEVLSALFAQCLAHCRERVYNRLSIYTGGNAG